MTAQPRFSAPLPVPFSAFFPAQRACLHDGSFRAFPVQCMVLLIGILFLTPGCDRTAERVVRGTTMGTVYTIRVPHAPARILSGFEQEVHARLEQIEAAMSAYRPESEISRFNALSAGESIRVSGDFDRVIRISLQVHAQTEGAFDPTVKPLLDLWGFGPGSPTQEAWHPPAKDVVNRVVAGVGMEHVDTSLSGRLGKRQSAVQLDLGGVAKGFAVDALAELLEERGVQDYLVDIGGDLRVSGRNSEGEPWRIGVNHPLRGQGWDHVLLVLRPDRGAVLTSGDYRQFIDHDGQFFSHVLDPRTGHPVGNNVASVTVLAETAVRADALATGLMVLGVQRGLKLVESLPGVEALFLTRESGETLQSTRSSGFAARGGL